MNDALASRWRTTPLPFFTPDLAGVGGALKSVPEDFRVDEIPAYEPCGEGEHLFLKIEKRDVSAEQLLRHLARSLDVPSSDIGVAGLKDRTAITTQFVSVPARRAEHVAAIDTDAITVLSTTPHRNKLKTGHLRGNRFTIVLRDVDENSLDAARAIADRISRHGFPNYYGAQRFGREDSTLATGLALLRGEKSFRDLPRKTAKFQLRLSISAVQSFLFNVCLAERLRDGLLSTVLTGDVMQVVASGGTFHADDPAAEQPRADAGEIVATGPMFGPQMKQPRGVPADREQAILDAHGITVAEFANYKKVASGTRRADLIRPGDLSITAVSDGLQFQFTLPPGVYATEFLREFRKTD